MGPKRKVAKVPNKKKIDLTPYGFQGLGVAVPGLTPINMNEYTVVKDPNEERKKALESVFKLPSTSLSTILPPETDTEKNIIKEFVTTSQSVLSPDVLTKKSTDPYTAERPPGSGPVDVEEVKKELDFSNDSLENTLIMDKHDIDNEDFELMDVDDISNRRTDKEQPSVEQPNGGKRRHLKMKTRKTSRKSKRGKKHLPSCKTKSKRRRTSSKRRYSR